MVVSPIKLDEADVSIIAIRHLVRQIDGTSSNQISDLRCSFRELIRAAYVEFDRQLAKVLVCLIESNHRYAIHTVALLLALQTT